MAQGIILAAGMGRRMKGATGGTPKSLMRVGGKSLIERNIGLMLAAGLQRAVVVTGYRSEDFDFLADEFPGRVVLVRNPMFETSNTVSSLFAVRDMLDRESFITTADIYLAGNPFVKYREDKDFYLLRNIRAYEKPDWIAELDEEGRFLDVDLQGHRGHAYTGISHWTNSGAAYLRDKLAGVDLIDPTQAGMYWDEIVLPDLATFDLRSMILESEDEVYEFDDMGDIELFEIEQGLDVAWN